ncbi:MAG: hypothetical protein PHE27_01930 [Alphaproteobacteria bacterium]|nr:hypothetical protein [Alphaproteobacteria bacterium]
MVKVPKYDTRNHERIHELGEGLEAREGYNPHLDRENDDFESLCKQLGVPEHIKEKLIHGKTATQLDQIVAKFTSGGNRQRLDVYRQLGVAAPDHVVKNAQKEAEEEKKQTARLIRASKGLLGSIVGAVKGSRYTRALLRPFGAFVPEPPSSQKRARNYTADSGDYRTPGGPCD